MDYRQNQTGISKTTKALKNKEELQRFIDYLQNERKYSSNYPWLRQRDLLIVYLIISSGLRISDICNIRVDDIINVDIGERFTITEQKTGNRHNVYMTKSVKIALDSFMRATSEKGFSSRKFLICSHKTRYSKDTVDRKAISKHLRRLGQECGMSTTTSAHCFRKTAAQLRLDQGASIEDISEWLHNGNIRNTRRYLAIDKENVKAIATMDVLE